MGNLSAIRMERAIAHGSTFGCNDLAMVAGIATLDVLASERLIENAALMGEQLLQALSAMIPVTDFSPGARQRAYDRHQIRTAKVYKTKGIMARPQKIIFTDYYISRPAVRSA